MPKRGEVLPWRVRYEWEHGVKGTEVFRSEDDANAFVAQLNVTAQRREITLKSAEVTYRFSDGKHPDRLAKS